VVTAENHTVIGGLGSAVAEAMAESGSTARLRRVGIDDTFAEGARTTPWLFKAYGLTAQHIVDAVWQALGNTGSSPVAETIPTAEGEYAPV
jgi:transketolase